MMLWWSMKCFSLFCGQGGWKWLKIGKREMWMMVERFVFISCFLLFWWTWEWSLMELKAILCNDCFDIIFGESVYGLNFILKSHYFITSDWLNQTMNWRRNCVVYYALLISYFTINLICFVLFIPFFFNSFLFIFQWKLKKIKRKINHWFWLKNSIELNMIFFVVWKI